MINMLFLINTKGGERFNEVKWSGCYIYSIFAWKGATSAKGWWCPFFL